jgi:glycosyltransferase involved in cell wall biosynthesis
LSSLPLVSVIVPALNEEADIVACLEAIAAQDYPVNHLEVIVVDGCSSDDTAAKAHQALGRSGFARSAVVPNPVTSTSSSLNVGLQRAAGDIVCRVDARTRIEPHHVRTCVGVLEARPEVVVVGGSQIAVARNPTAIATGIARALNNRWAMGGSPYRRATVSGPSDTVYLGTFRRTDLQAVGGWDERLITNQDFDLNRRLSERGIVWFEQELRSGYIPRPDLRRLWAQYRRFGRAKARYWRVTGDRPNRRQMAALMGLPVGGAIGLGALRADGRGVLGLLAGALAVEHLGSKGPPGGPAARGVAVVAMAVTSLAWWSGVIQGTLRPEPGADTS